MKTTKMILASAVLMLLVAFQAEAQSQTKVIAVINKAAWCPVCKANGERAMSALMSGNKDGVIQFVANDVTDKNTCTKSDQELSKFELEKEMVKHKGTGVAYFFNAKTKAYISEISLSQPDEKLMEAESKAATRVK